MGPWNIKLWQVHGTLNHQVVQNMGPWISKLIRTWDLETASCDKNMGPCNSKLWQEHGTLNHQVVQNMEAWIIPGSCVEYLEIFVSNLDLTILYIFKSSICRCGPDLKSGLFCSKPVLVLISAPILFSFVFSPCCPYPDSPKKTLLTCYDIHYTVFCYLVLVIFVV